MKKRMSYRVLLLIVGIVCCFVLFSVAVGCNLSASGADSDNSDEIDGQIFYDNDPQYDITDVGFAEGAGPFTVPSGYGNCNGAWIEIDMENNSASGVELHLNLTSTDVGSAHVVLTLQPGDGLKEIYFIRLNDGAEGTDLYLWHNENDLGASADLTDVTIQADIIYWLFNLSGAAN